MVQSIHMLSQYENPAIRKKEIFTSNKVKIYTYEKFSNRKEE